MAKKKEAGAKQPRTAEQETTGASRKSQVRAADEGSTAGSGRSRAEQVRAADEGSTAGSGRSRAEQVRAAVEQAFEATTHGAGPMRERAQELAEELAGAASRFREVLEELRPPGGDELAALRARVDTLERRVAELEAEKAATGKPAARRAAAKSPATTTPPAARATGTAKGAKGASASPGASTAKRGKAASRTPRGTTGS
jgi:polyhydroxyalkanoate synthesis regulator phasin